MYQEDVYVMHLHQYLGKNPEANERDFLIHEIERRSSDSIENVLKTPLNNLPSNIKYFKIKLDRLPPENKTKSKERSLPYQIALLNELGFFELDKLKALPKDKVYQVVANLLNADKRGVSGNHRVLDPNSLENRIKFTSFNHVDKVRKYLDEL